MADTFNPSIPPQEEPVGTVRLRTRRMQFGDGYMNVVVDGLNPKIQKWPISFKGGYTEIGVIRDFLDSHVGKSFWWTPPLGVPGLYVMDEEYTLTPSAADWAVLSFTLLQVYFP